ncbi:family 43 glycosylhydrolase [Xanthomonas floridensis]|uniref:Extracellular exo-alpha-(1->5)-L-arabinofuranosidase n=1 Tax=Xanthomonas floridensis TaxID=1843580 RepID=A0ABU5Q332_9XANT|nr:arabinan endo-1,5-alpha-L-arabinosidase [Xanthomonas floridensis]MEA5126300.1 arabinan endo-1,5-alpha-L-arabinosidase [Xanthomonas floridensis]MEA5134240.1 arabinan endo-1,5-alpha-L-arabinosidase [Xanthomonas floridensis]
MRVGRGNRWEPVRAAGALRVGALALLCAAVGAVSGVDGAGAWAATGPGVVTGDTIVHDPSMLKLSDGRYYIYATTGVVTSTDRTKFSNAGAIFSSMPSWVRSYNPDNQLWAPDVSFHGGKYLMYYTASRFATNTSAIALASSSTGKPGSWKDQGIVYTSKSSDDYNAIDGNLVVDGNGKWWLAFGSFWSGIKLIQLDPGTGKQLASNMARYSLASRPAPGAVEAPFIQQANGWYYLFVSFDACCKGASSTYKIAVGRARSVTGPYLDRAGVDMRNGGGTVIHAGQGSMHGPGGQSVFRDGDGDILVYHYYDDRGDARLGVNRLGYDGSAWPVVQ